MRRVTVRELPPPYGKSADPRRLRREVRQLLARLDRQAAHFEADKAEYLRLIETLTAQRDAALHRETLLANAVPGLERLTTTLQHAETVVNGLQTLATQTIHVATRRRP